MRRPVRSNGPGKAACGACAGGGLVETDRAPGGAAPVVEIRSVIVGQERSESARRIVHRVAVATFVLLSPQVSSATTQTDESNPSAFLRAMNRGKALLENRNANKAIDTTLEAVQLNPKSARAQRNLARAFMLKVKHEQALDPLTTAAALEVESAATSYLTGLSLTRLSRFEQAIPHLETAVRLDPQSAALRYQLASAYQVTQAHEKAIEQLRETVRLDPFHASGHFKLGGYARRDGDREEFQRRTREFMRLRKIFGDKTRSVAALEQCAHTQPEAAVMQAKSGALERSQPIPVRFVDITNEVMPDQFDVSAAAVLSVDAKGHCILITAASDGRLSLIRTASGKPWERNTIDITWPEPMRFDQCVIADFHNDIPKGVKFDADVHALNDILLIGPSGLRLIKQIGADVFKDVTQAAGLAGIAARTAAWVDFEHDGDVDLLVGHATGLALWQNNGNGTFENVTERVGISDTGSVTGVAAVDLDANVAIDLIVARGSDPTLVIENKRAGSFAAMTEPPGPWPAANRVQVNDIDNDGLPDVLLIADREAIVQHTTSTPRSRLSLADIASASTTLVDFDNDGWLDICVVGAKRNEAKVGAIQLWRNVSGGRGSAVLWTNVTQATGLAAISVPEIRDVLAVDVDADADTDLVLLTANNRLRVLRNEGGHVNGQIKLRLSTIKSNPTALGTHIELRDERFYVAREVIGAAIEIGLGGRKHLDSLQTLWPNGVVDNQVDISTHAVPLRIVEKNVPTGSCPFLYVWDGSGYRFVTDLLGNSPIGLPLRRGVMLPADPDEIVRIGTAESFAPVDGAFLLQITDEFREIFYLDKVRLMTVDHPEEVEVHSTDKIMPTPFPSSEVWAMSDPRTAQTAIGDDGIDRTAALRRIDDVFAPPGSPLPPPYRGMCHPMSLTMDFGRLDMRRPYVLALTGWLQYGDGSTNVAMGQNADLAIIPPTLHAERSDGSWQPVDVVVGMPAGKTKTILCDLTGKLPEDTHRLMLTTTFEIRWDRIALLTRQALPASSVHHATPVSAELRWRGFSELAARRSGHPMTPAYEIVTDRPPWRTVLSGWCTRYGDVLDLVTGRDDRMAILNAGDALEVRFDAAALPPIPSGQRRTFFLYTVGWDKDGDHNITNGETVEPLPVGLSDIHPDENRRTRDDWRLRFNTRWVPRDRFRAER